MGLVNGSFKPNIYIENRCPLFDLLCFIVLCDSDILDISIALDCIGKTRKLQFKKKF